MNPPGIRPPAYVNSRYSTVSGKKSIPSFASGEEVAVARTTLSPLEVSAAPGACLAIRPVSNLICLPPASSTVTSCFMLPLFSRFHSIKLVSRHPSSGREKVQLYCAATWPPENCTGIDRFRVVYSSEPQTAETTPASVISNSRDKVLLDLARTVHPTEDGPCVLP